jgi:hypothetical protein
MVPFSRSKRLFRPIGIRRRCMPLIQTVSCSNLLWTPEHLTVFGGKPNET